MKLQSISSSKRWLTCTKSLEFNQDFIENENTIKGNMQHALAELLLREKVFKENHEEEINTLLNEGVKFGLKTILFDKKMIETAKAYVDFILNKIKEINPDEIYFEKEVIIKLFNNEKKGIIDCLFIKDDTSYIYDLKTGFSFVDPEDNYQLNFYAVGVLQNDTKHNIKNFEFGIIQPLRENFESVFLTKNDIIKFYFSHAKTFKDIEEGNLIFNPEEDVCRFCDHKKECNAYLEYCKRKKVMKEKEKFNF